MSSRSSSSSPARPASAAAARFTPAAPLRLGTRASPLALRQAEEVKARLVAVHALAPDAVEIVPMSTAGDREQSRPLADIGGKGLFALEIERALGAGEIHLAVHSMKDVETRLQPGFEIAAMLPREDVRDVWLSPVAAHPRDLPEGAVVGTASLRRGAQLLALRPDLRIVNFRGNVQTRLAKLARGEVAGTLLALAGLNRLGMADEARTILEPPEMVPAVGQGAIGIEVRGDDAPVRALVAALDDTDTHLCVACERAMLAELDGTCRTPIGGHARLLADGRVHLEAVLLTPDGAHVFRHSASARREDAAALGAAAAQHLRAQAGPLMDTILG